jgi:hypothetical protein
MIGIEVCALWGMTLFQMEFQNVALSNLIVSKCICVYFKDIKIEFFS